MAQGSGSQEMDAVLILRLIERCLAVVIGGLCIFFGYRLFLALPDMREASGQFSLPLNIRIVVSRVGPGVFFALFGASIVALSLYQSVQYERSAPGEPAVAQASNYEKFAGLGSKVSGNEAQERADARALLRRDFAVLNTLPRLLKPDLPRQDVDMVAAASERVKLALMRPVWGGPQEGWGDAASFEAWLKTGRPKPLPIPLAEPARLFFYGMPEDGQ
jgi:hypothetical protein